MGDFMNQVQSGTPDIFWAQCKSREKACCAANKVDRRRSAVEEQGRWGLGAAKEAGRPNGERAEGSGAGASNSSGFGGLGFEGMVGIEPVAEGI